MNNTRVTPPRLPPARPSIRVSPQAGHPFHFATHVAFALATLLACASCAAPPDAAPDTPAPTSRTTDVDGRNGQDGETRQTGRGNAAPPAVPRTSSPSAPPAAPALSDEADARALERLLADEKNLFDSLANDPETRRRTFDEQERRVLEIGRRYEELLRRRVNDAAVMILYGKFLRRIDDRAHADRWFREASHLAPNLALPKHQMGVYAAEEGDYARAHALLEEAAALEPATATYHFHLGEFLAIWRDHLARDKRPDPRNPGKHLDRAACDNRMVEAFRRAAELRPAETVYLWRHAEAFADCETPDWPAALRAWNALAPRMQTDLDRETLSLYRARALIGMNLPAEAEALLARSVSPKLAPSRARLRALLDETKQTAPASAVAPTPAPLSPAVTTK